MHFETDRTNSARKDRVVLTVFAIMILPTALWVTGESLRAADENPKATTEKTDTTKDAGEKATTAAANPDEKKEPREETPYPQLIEATPAAGSTDVDPKLTEIRVTFDRDMSEGMSWTGGGSEFPGDASQKAKWIDKRTCVLPVMLKKAGYFRVGINSKSHQNFKAADGTATPPTAIFFTTKGASKDLEKRVLIPEVVEISPANDEKDVPASTAELSVTFNMPMGEGMSWTGGGDAFPQTPEGGKAKWSKDGRTCTLPVTLEPDHEYKLGLNSLSHNNFQSKWGVPLKPMIYTFRTAK
ncbi:MAG: hypothetical protein H7Z17_03715 [Fuerstia sp.]|nr:hypothetical protein [Fuerstiella sp.]